MQLPVTTYTGKTERTVLSFCEEVLGWMNGLYRMSPMGILSVLHEPGKNEHSSVPRLMLGLAPTHGKDG